MKRCFVKPIFSSAVMGVVVFFTYKLCALGLGNTISTLVAVFVGVIVYALLVIITKNLNKEDLISVPMGAKICSLLERFRLI